MTDQSGSDLRHSGEAQGDGGPLGDQGCEEALLGGVPQDHREHLQ